MADFRSVVAAIDGYDHFDALPAAPTRGYTVYHPGAPSPSDRRLTGRAMVGAVVDRVLCVGNTADGAVLLASRVCDALDGLHSGGGLVECSTGPTIRDPDQTGDFRWSVTVTVDYSTAR